MITVEALLFAAFGFLLAGILALLLAPFYRSRTVRLATARLKSEMPFTEDEIRADRGLLRATHAVALRDLELRLNKLNTVSSSAWVEVNRRDARIGELEERLRALETDLETMRNAKRVLERTILDRVPDVERHLRDAEAALGERDGEINQLRDQSAKTFRALDEAMQINEQQRRDIARLNEQLQLSEVRDVPASPAGNREAAMQAELSGLRAKSREQMALIGRLQAMLGDGRGRHGSDRGLTGGAANDDIKAAEDLAGSDDRAGKRGASGTDAEDQTVVARLALADGRIEDQDRELRSLRSQIAELESQLEGRQAKESVRNDDGKSVQKAQVVALETLRTEQEATIRRLRAELAASNERMARQAAHFMDELRRLGGARPQTGSGRRSSVLGAARKADVVQRITDAVPEARAATAGIGRQRERSVQSTSSVSEADTTIASSAPVKPVVLQAAPDLKDKPVKRAEERSSKGLVARISDLDEKL